jgi:hypothetical protein
MTEQEAEAEFKNFHRSLCERFGYCHDEEDWKRDQVSLEEHIASLIAKPVESPEQPSMSTGDAAGVNQQLLEALELIYDKYENGDGVFEDPENFDGPLGNAVRLSGEEENQILRAFESAGVRTALSAFDESAVSRAPV